MKSDAALLVIDMQLCAFDGKITPPIFEGDKILNIVGTLIDDCRTFGLPIIFIQTCAVSGRPYAKDSHGWEIHPELKKKPTDPVIYKTQSSAFEDTKLVSALSELGISKLITCGIWSEYCLANTSLDALNLDYSVTVVADAHSTVADTNIGAMQTVAEQNDRLAKNGARLLNASEIIQALR